MATFTQPSVQQEENDRHALDSSRSAPQNTPSGPRCHDIHRNSSSSNAGASSAPLAGSSPHSYGSSGSDGHSSDLRQQRYGKWPPSSSTPPCYSRSSSTGSSSRLGERQFSRSGSSSGGRRGFSWPAYMDRQQLQQAMKRGQVFRAKFRVNAANRNEAFCSLEGLPSDLTVRGETNHNRAVEGDEVAVLAFKLSDWFTVYKERDRLQHLGLLPEGDADPITLADQLSQLALAAHDDAGLALAQSPWHAAGLPAAALDKIGEILTARPDMRVTGKVVSILEPSPRREAIVGVLLPPDTAMKATAAPAGGQSTPAASAAAAALSSGGYEGFLMLVPLDPRLPKGLLSPDVVAGLPENLRSEAAGTGLTTRTFVAARLIDWPSGSPFPFVEVRQSLGPTGDIDAGTAAILAAEGVRDEDFSLEVYACLPRVPWSISPSEAAVRADFTSWRIFSIDPITARDLDDALSIQPLAGGRWRMGVHIADVASFIKPGTALDEEAQLRGTSVYLVQKVIPMLPRLLCEQLCSLQPGDPRCSFSIVWEIDDNGHIYKEWAGRSIINSCAKLAYPMVQQMIDGCFDPQSWQIQLFNGVTWDQIIFDCLALHGIASRLRAARFASGALRLNNTRLNFAVDTGGNPVSASPYIQSEANHLVEEYMLLANMRVAGIISTAFPKHAMLRRHPPPNQRKMGEFKAAANMLGVEVDSSTAGALQESLRKLQEACKDDASREAIMLLATKPMLLAQYFCTGEAADPASWGHYALAVQRYTHFTSPIRRYPDVIVHRLLQAAIELAQQQQQPDNADLLSAPVATEAQLPTPVTTAGGESSAAAISTAAAVSPSTAAAVPTSTAAAAGSSPHQQHYLKEDEDEDAAAAAILSQHQIPDTQTLAKIAKHSNDTKTSARLVQDGSLKLYLCITLKQQPVVTWAVVTAVGGDKFFTAYLPEFGCETKLHLQLMGVPLAGSWDIPSQTLTIKQLGKAQQQEEQLPVDGPNPFLQASAAAAISAPAAVTGGREQRGSDDDGRLPPEMLLNSPNFKLKEWLEGLKDGVINRSNIQHAQLPLRVQVFSRLPVIVGTYINRVTCHPEDVSAKLWLACGAASELEHPAAETAIPGQETMPSVMLYDNLIED